MNDRDRYMQNAHAMQSGVAMMMNYDTSSVEPKHLRVGVNSAMSDNAALVQLLIEKGILTKEEYEKAIADKMEEEKAFYEQKLSQVLNRPVTLA